MKILFSLSLIFCASLAAMDNQKKDPCEIFTHEQVVEISSPVLEISKSIFFGGVAQRWDYPTLAFLGLTCHEYTKEQLRNKINSVFEEEMRTSEMKNPCDKYLMTCPATNYNKFDRANIYDKNCTYQTIRSTITKFLDQKTKNGCLSESCKAMPQLLAEAEKRFEYKKWEKEQEKLKQEREKEELRNKEIENTYQKMIGKKK